MKKSKKILSVLLAVLILISIFSAAMPVFAAEVAEASTNATEKPEDSQEYYGGFPTAGETEGVFNKVIGEDESRRDENVKHFILNDGSRKAVIYTEPVHYKENGKWKDIDNTLEYDETTQKYKNKNNSFKVNFGKKLNDDELFSIENKGYSLKWKYAQNKMRTAFVDGKVKNNVDNTNKNDLKADKIRSKIEYKNFESNSNLEYVVTPTGVKENIILENSNSSNEYSFIVKAKDLTLVKNDDGSISAVTVDNKEIFHIPAPFMFDSADEYSYDVEYDITENHTGTYIIKVVADRAWLDSNDRVYPVTIDPAISTTRDRSYINSTFVASDPAYCNDNTLDEKQILSVGWDSSTYGQTRTLVKFTLPELQKSEVVVSASLNLVLHSASFYASTVPDTQIDAHIINDSWDYQNTTWNNMPEFDEDDDVVLDYAHIKRTDVGNASWKKFDITKAVKGWHDGTLANNGIMIKRHIETGTYANNCACAYFWSEKYNNEYNLYPYISIQYRNNKGLENYWSFTTASAGSAGTAYVNDYTGNLVFALPIASTVSERAPVTLEAYFNTYCAGEKIGTGTGDKFKELRTALGRGWRLNYQQTVKPSTDYGLTGDYAENYPYVYTDGEGTEHYFLKVIKNEGEPDEKITYEDEDGLGITLTTATSGYTYKLTTKDDSQYLFNSMGNLFRIVDSNGNQINVEYFDANGSLPEKSRIKSITDGVGHKFTFEYYSNDYVKKITDNAGRVVEFDISEGRLNSVKYSDGRESKIVYEGTTEGLINYIEAHEGYKVNFNYTSKATGRRVSSIREYGKSSTLGQKMTFDYSQYNQTVIRSCGVDGVFDNNDDILKTYQFDNCGKLTSQKVALANGSQSVAGNTSYVNQTDEENKNIKATNRVSSTAGLGKNVVNHIKGGNCETLSYWRDTITDATGSITASNAKRYYGSKAMKIYISKLSATTGRIYALQDIDKLKENRTYTFSAYVNVSEFEKYPGASVSGAYLSIRPLNAAGEFNGDPVNSKIISEVTTQDINNGFRRISVNVTLPAGSVGARVYTIFKGATGTVYFDGLQVEYGSYKNPFNFLINSSFEFETDHMPNAWEPSNISTQTEDYVTITNAFSGSTSMKITGEADSDKRLYQYVYVTGEQNDTYILSGWASADAVNNTHHYNVDDKGTSTTDDDEIESYKTQFDILATVYFKDSNGNEISTQKHYSAKFNTTISGWQFTSTAFSLQFPGHEEYRPYKIRIMPRYYQQANAAYFDSIQLIKDVAQSYVYDSEGNMTTVNANAEQQNNMKYDGEDNLTEYKDAVGNVTSFKYEKNTHNLDTSTSPKGITTDYNYNSAGNVTSTNVINSQGKREVLSENTYTEADSESGISAGAYLRSSRDQHDNRTIYTYDYATGANIQITDANMNRTYYDYDDNYNQLESITSDDSKVAYNYSDDKRLNKIIFGDTKKEEYSFMYDSYGNIQYTKVGSQKLSTNTYKPNNGLLEKTTYGNGDIVSYEYDNYGNKTKTTKGGNVFTWAYNSGGVNTSHKDIALNRQYVYSYDSIGRLVRQDIYNATNDNYIGATEFKFDNRNNLTKLAVDMDGNTVTQSYKYSAISGIEESADAAKENLPTRYNITSARYVDYDYDSLNRLDSKTFQLATNHTLVTDYTYYPSNRNEDGSVTYQTDQLKSEVIDNQGYLYYYDDVGNITQIKKATSTDLSNPTDFKTFEYDGLNQLKSETVAGVGKTVYTYDELGNILKKEFYSYGEYGKLSSTADETVYTYSQGIVDDVKNWNHLLTGVDLDGNGTTDTATETISYDEIGNPTTYLGAELEWFGRQLLSYTKGTTDVDYTYDANGLRSTKTVNGVKSEYLYLDGQLVYEKRGNTGYYYFYDANGHFAGLKWFDEQGEPHAYYALTSSMGDVLGLYNNTGELVASYEYDTWGNVIGVYNVSKNDEGKYVYTLLDETVDKTHIAVINPIRYRGYYYDTETKLYYLQSRYYNPKVGRFLNSDSISDQGAGLIGYNPFVCSGNNPVNCSDPSGHFVISAFVASVVIGAVSSMAVETFSQLINNGGDVKSLNGGRILLSGVVGGICGGITGGVGAGLSSVTGHGLLKAGARVLAGGVSSAIGDSLNKMIDGEKITASSIGKSFAWGCVSSAAVELGSAAVIKVNSNKFDSYSHQTQKIELKKYIQSNKVTTSFIRNGDYIGTAGYNEYIGHNSDGVGTVLGFCFELFAEGVSQ